MAIITPSRKLTMPENTRGRYRARRAPDDSDGMVPLMGMPRLDLPGVVAEVLRHVHAARTGGGRR